MYSISGMILTSSRKASAAEARCSETQVLQGMRVSNPERQILAPLPALRLHAGDDFGRQASERSLEKTQHEPPRFLGLPLGTPFFVVFGALTIGSIFV